LFYAVQSAFWGGGCNLATGLKRIDIQEVIQSALQHIIAPERIYGTQFQYGPASGEIQALLRVPTGYGKIDVLDELQSTLHICPDRIVYMGDGRSDVHVMLHVNRRDGLRIAVSEANDIAPRARRTILMWDGRKADPQAGDASSSRRNRHDAP
jgi:hypothetical protein